MRARRGQRHLALARSVGVVPKESSSGTSACQQPLALVLGSEGHGVSQSARRLRGATRVGVPLARGLESLGVAQVALAACGSFVCFVFHGFRVAITNMRGGCVRHVRHHGLRCCNLVGRADLASPT